MNEPLRAGIYPRKDKKGGNPFVERIRKYQKFPFPDICRTSTEKEDLKLSNPVPRRRGNRLSTKKV